MRPDAARPPLILASSSRYRRELLARLEIPFECVAPGVDESPLQGEAPRDTTLRLAHAKMRAVLDRRPDAIVIGSDQVAECDGRAVNKPGTHDAAVEQLRFLSRRTAIFHTALCVGRHEIVERDVVATTVTFRALDDAMIDRYLRRDEPYDCAGSAKVEALGIALLSRVQADDPTALIGLPLIRLVAMLEALGLRVLDA